MKPQLESQLKLILKHKQVQKAHASKFFLHLFNTYGINRRAKYLLIIRLSFVSPNTPILPLFSPLFNPNTLKITKIPPPFRLCLLIFYNISSEAKPPMPIFHEIFYVIFTTKP